ncbi:MAG TPA: hypothetical protein VG452_01935, partial [Egibacteraceae bacterium]|nr:hypothetical protein [Egibacteraceae bacterium]
MLDDLVERLGRRMARRSTRRSFLARAGRAAVLVASGPTVAVLLADEAQARVCGQSGVAPRCSTFDCDETWGWCWYATGCCADGALKKICDCCAADTPNPVGYCPSGTRVLCIVESCGADPRLQTRTVVRLTSDDPVAIALDVSRRRYPSSWPIAVVGDAESAPFAAVAASLGKVVDGPVLLSRRDSLSPEVDGELARLGVEFVKVVGSQLAGAVDEALRARGVGVERVGSALDVESFSADVCRWSRAMTGARSALVVASGPAGDATPAAAGFAHARGWPLLIGTGPQVRAALNEPRAVHTTYVVGGSAGDETTFPGGVAVAAGSAGELAGGIADAALAAGVSPAVVGLAPAGKDLISAALATAPGPLLLRGSGTLDGARDWLFAHRPDILAAYVGGTDFGDDAYDELQSILNEFETHLLRGGPGEG